MQDFLSASSSETAPTPGNAGISDQPSSSSNSQDVLGRDEISEAGVSGADLSEEGVIGEALERQGEIIRALKARGLTNESPEVQREVQVGFSIFVCFGGCLK